MASRPSISDDGRFVAFSSDARDLVADREVYGPFVTGVIRGFLHDSTTGLTARVGPPWATFPMLSGDAAHISGKGRERTGSDLRPEPRFVRRHLRRRSRRRRRPAIVGLEGADAGRQDARTGGPSGRHGWLRSISRARVGIEGRSELGRRRRGSRGAVLAKPRHLANQPRSGCRDRFAFRAGSAP